MNKFSSRISPTGSMKLNYFFSILFFVSLSVISAVGPKQSGCLEKEKALTFLEIAENILSKATDSFSSCREEINSTYESECGNKKPLAYIEILKKLISDARENFPTCHKIIEKYDKPRDCSKVLESGLKKSGIYTIWPKEPFTTGEPLQAYCDMQTDDGGWTVIQRRGKYPVQQDFQKDWESYKNGFGNLSEEFWLGNENIRFLCLMGCEIRFDLQDKNGEKGFALYQSFELSGSNYRLSISGYTGNVGPGMKDHNNYVFSTKDKNDAERARKLKSGWWHLIGDGYDCNLNGIYQHGTYDYENVWWYPWRRTDNLASVEMKVRSK